MPIARRWPARRSGWTALLVGCMVAAPAGTMAAQQGGGGGGRAQAAADSARTTRAGVYTQQQALRGRDTYAGMCASCHPAVTHTGPTFVAAWNGRPLSELFDYMRENMPKSDPGILTAQEYAQVLAYVLRMNGMPPGERELGSDPAVLRPIRIDLEAKPPGGDR